MHPISQIIERNLHRRKDGGDALWVNPAKDQLWTRAMDACNSMALFTQDFATHSFLEKTGAVSSFSAFPPASGRGFDWILINLPRQKALLRMLLDASSELLAEDGVIWLAGENRAGIKSADKLLKESFAQITKLDNARHCTLFEARGALKGNAFEPATYREKWVLDIDSREIRVVSYPGVFAHGRLDAGTSLLLQALNRIDIKGKVLDFACGAGVVGACIATCHAGSSLTMLDINALALQSSRETFESSQLQGTFIPSDGLSGLTEKYDFIVSNPPIHAGVKTDNQLGVRLLENAHQYLNPGGSLIIVANIHLPYEKHLSNRFRQTRQLMANDRFKVIAATI